MNELDRVVRHALADIGNVGGIVTDTSSGYENRSLMWSEYDEARPSIGFQA